MLVWNNNGLKNDDDDDECILKTFMCDNSLPQLIMNFIQTQRNLPTLLDAYKLIPPACQYCKKLKLNP